MNRRSITRALCAILLAAMITSMPAQAQSPATTVVEDLLAAMAAKDAAKIRTLFAANATQQYGTGPLKSGEALRAWIESDVIAAQATVDASSIEAVGDDVVVRGTIRNNRGYSNAANFLFGVAGNKIIKWQIRY